MKKRLFNKFVMHFFSVLGDEKNKYVNKMHKLRKNIRKICHSYVGQLVLIFWLMPYCMPLLTFIAF